MDSVDYLFWLQTIFGQNIRPCFENQNKSYSKILVEIIVGGRGKKRPSTVPLSFGQQPMAIQCVGVACIYVPPTLYSISEYALTHLHTYAHASMLYVPFCPPKSSRRAQILMVYERMCILNHHLPHHKIHKLTQQPTNAYTPPMHSGHRRVLLFLQSVYMLYDGWTSLIAIRKGSRHMHHAKTTIY